MEINKKVQCPRCGKVWTVNPQHSEIMCNCHTYCSEGTKPSDCTLVAKTSGTVPFSGVWKWPSGMHNSDVNLGDDTQARTYYCTVHEIYSNKVPFLIGVDEPVGRYKRKLRLSHGKY